ncbi:unnamed protein product [Danaus chrysippus]|uniref:(African queen) hypothetical protein n=1 Tax=Danaus chrysippus TaxID=151541 RepID=A0A8J2QW08_9NEOP|nr:unnamed protein product [Danaus chrysippus]
MSEREGPGSSGSQDNGEKGMRIPNQSGPSGPSYFASEPITFRVRGSTITGASPPKFVTLEDIMKAAHGMQNMALAHEIAVDQDFKLEPFEPPDNRAILEALEILKLDLANTLIAMIRPHVQKESVQYERTKFDEMLKVSEDGLQHTRQWLLRHIDKSDLSLPISDVNIIRNVTAQTLAKAYLELLEWDDSKTYPETLHIDKPRFTELGIQVYRLVCVASLLLVSPSCGEQTTHKQKLKEKIFIIMDTTSNDIELKQILPSVAEEVVLETDQLLETLGQAPLTNETKDVIRSQILSLRDNEHRVRQIVRQRVLEFLKMVLVCAGGARQVPVGLSAFTNELTSVSGTLLRYVMHNKAVFTSHYMDIITEELSKN